MPPRRGVVRPAHQTKLKINLQAKAVLMTDEAVGKNPAQYANESTKGLDGALTPLDGASQKAGELMRNIPKAADLPTLNGEVMAPFRVIEVAARQGLGLSGFMHEVTLP